MSPRTVADLIAAERAHAARPRLVLQADWCRDCLGPLGVHDVDRCEECRDRPETPAKTGPPEPLEIIKG